VVNTGRSETGVDKRDEHGGSEIGLVFLIVDLLMEAWICEVNSGRCLNNAVTNIQLSKLINRTATFNCLL
jgi:hypothetical protein